MNEKDIIKLALAGVHPLPVKWTIKPPLCELNCGRFASNIYFDVAGKETALCPVDYGFAIQTEIVAADKKKELVALDQMRKERLAKLAQEPLTHSG